MNLPTVALTVAFLLVATDRSVQTDLTPRPLEVMLASADMDLSDVHIAYIDEDLRLVVQSLDRTYKQSFGTPQHDENGFCIVAFYDEQDRFSMYAGPGGDAWHLRGFITHGKHGTVPNWGYFEDDDLRLIRPPLRFESVSGDIAAQWGAAYGYTRPYTTTQHMASVNLNSGAMEVTNYQGILVGSAEVARYGFHVPFLLKTYGFESVTTLSESLALGVIVPDWAAYEPGDDTRGRIVLIDFQRGLVADVARGRYVLVASGRIEDDDSVPAGVHPPGGNTLPE